MGRARRIPANSFLYVIAPEAEGGEVQQTKIGRSVKPLQRRSQMQTGNGSKLRLVGQWKVAYADAPRLEAAAKAALAPLRIKGEVFRVHEELACAVVEWIAAGREIDALLDVAIRHEIAEQEWTRINRKPSAGGRWAKPETVAALEAAEAEVKRLHAEMCALDIERARRIDPFISMFDAAREAPKKRNSRRDPHAIG